MTEYRRNVRATRVLEYRLPASQPWGATQADVGKALAAIHAELADTGCDVSADDAVRMFPGDDEIVLTANLPDGDAPPASQAEALRSAHVQIADAVKRAETAEKRLLLAYGIDPVFWPPPDDDALPVEAFWDFIVESQELSQYQKVIITALTGYPFTTSQSAPNFVEEFIACDRLLDEVPIAREHLPRLTRVSTAWSKAVDRWDEIVSAGREDDHDRARQLIGEVYTTEVRP